MLPACNAPAGLKEDARELREDVERCSEGDECVLISVASDCTGLLGCPFPVHAARKAYAEERAKESAEASRGLSGVTFSERALSKLRNRSCNQCCPRKLAKSHHETEPR